MKRLFNYCFYRIALFYKKRMTWEDYLTQGHTLLITAFSFYAITIANILLQVFGSEITKELLIAIFLPFGIIILFNYKFFPNSEQLFEKMAKEYKNERFKWFKGLLVFLFIVFSFISMGLSYTLKHYL